MTLMKKPMLSSEVFELESFKQLCKDLGIDTELTKELTIFLSSDDFCTYEQVKYAKKADE